MALYMIGDVQGCDDALARLLDTLAFSPSRDVAWLMGDLVNRGPQSAAALRRVMASNGALRTLLGNHDMHMLAHAAGFGRRHRLDTFDDVLHAPDATRMLDWLREQMFAAYVEGALLVHAGVDPRWDLSKTIALSQELTLAITGNDSKFFFERMYGNVPARWSDDLQGMDRLRAIVNVFTRMRFCAPDGTMDFDVKEGVDRTPAGMTPWYDAPGRRTADVPIVFGHWSTLGWLGREDVYCVDTGCVWGRQLTALRWSADPAGRETIAIDCPVACPG